MLMTATARAHRAGMGPLGKKSTRKSIKPPYTKFIVIRYLQKGDSMRLAAQIGLR